MPSLKQTVLSDSWRSWECMRVSAGGSPLRGGHGWDYSVPRGLVTHTELQFQAAVRQSPARPVSQRDGVHFGILKFLFFEICDFRNFEILRFSEFWKFPDFEISDLQNPLNFLILDQKNGKFQNIFIANGAAPWEIHIQSPSSSIFKPNKALWKSKISRIFGNFRLRICSPGDPLHNAAPRLEAKERFAKPIRKKVATGPIFFYSSVNWSHR